TPNRLRALALRAKPNPPRAPAPKKTRLTSEGPTMMPVPSDRAMPASLLVGCLLLSASCGFGAEGFTLQSHSGQFVVRGLSTAPSPFQSESTPAVTHIRLDPASLA